MPVLARLIENAGIPTVIVTPMPDLASHVRLSRIVGVEFPFAQAFGMVGDLEMQREVALAAVGLLAEATEPETRNDLSIEWPLDTRSAYRAWQPAEVSPIVAANLAQMRKARGAETKSD